MDERPVVILDDSPSSTCTLAQGVRRFAGRSTLYFRSVPAFLRYLNWKYEDGLAVLGEKLSQYSAIICDNNFEAQDHEQTSDGWVRGIDFLLGKVGPAVLNLPEQERPYLVCFSPSSEEVIRLHEKELWDEYKIASFHRAFEALAIGIAIKLSEIYKTPFSREALICGILRFEKEYPDGFQSEKHDFFIGLNLDHISGNFQDEEMWQIEGEARGISWEELADAIASGLHIETGALQTRIEGQVELLQFRTIEGPLRMGKELE